MLQLFEGPLMAVDGSSPLTDDIGIGENQTLRRRVRDAQEYAVYGLMSCDDSCKGRACGVYVVAMQVRHAE